MCHLTWRVCFSAASGTQLQHSSTLGFEIMLGKWTRAALGDYRLLQKLSGSSKRPSKAHWSWMSTNMAQLCKPGKHYSCWQACLGTAIRVLFFNVRRMPSRNLSYDHKHLDCSVNHRGCWRICNRKKKTVGTLGAHSFQPFHIHRSVFSFPPTVSSRPFSSRPSDFFVNHNF